MAASFIGLTVSIILKSPPNARIQGRVSSIADQVLTLQDAVFLASGLRMPEFRIHGSNIIDLDVRSSEGAQAVEKSNHSPLVPGSDGLPTLMRQENDPGPAHGKAQQEEGLGYPAASHIKLLVDPAIVSIRRKPSQSANHRDTESLYQEKAQDTYQNASLTITSHPPEPLPHDHGNMSGKSVHEPSAGKDLLEEGDASTSDAGTALLRQPNVVSRSDKSGKPIGLTTRVDSIKMFFTDKERTELSQSTTELTVKARATLDQDQDPDILPVRKESNRRKRRRARKRSKGLASEAEDKSIAKRPGGQRVAFGHDKSPWKVYAGDKTRLGVSTSNRHSRLRDDDGWATEEATDIQGMGEFDFQGNLSKFDKRTVFDQIRAQDSTVKESRLVSLNRLPAKSGTAGGKNLHHTENVLDSKDGGRWNSEAGETEEEISGGRIGSGRSSRRTISRQSAKQLPSRKGSNIFGSSGQFISSSSTRVLSPLHREPQSGRTTSSTPGRYSRIGSPMRSMTPSSVGSLRLVPSGRLCPVLRPIQQLDIERIAEVELGFTEDMMTENAGRGVAEIAMAALDLDGRRPTKEERKVEPPFAVVLTGNHQSGLRAIAAARHLHNHGVRVIVCVLGLEREALLLENIRRQLQIFERSGGRVGHWEDLMTELESSDNGSPELVIDALLGTHLSYGDLRRDDQTVAYNLIDWVNNGKFEVLALDIPTGIDASTGKVSYLEGEPMCMNAKFVAALGAPKAGLLEALSSGLGSNWTLYVVDLGISNTAWKAYGTRKKHGVEFGGRWIMELKYQGISD